MDLTEELHELAEQRRKAQQGSHTVYSEFGTNYRRQGEQNSGGAAAARQRMKDRQTMNDVIHKSDSQLKEELREAEEQSKAEQAEQERLDLFARLRGFRSYKEYLEDLQTHRSPTSY